MSPWVTVERSTRVTRLTAVDQGSTLRKARSHIGPGAWHKYSGPLPQEINSDAVEGYQRERGPANRVTAISHTVMSLGRTFVQGHGRRWISRRRDNTRGGSATGVGDRIGRAVLIDGSCWVAEGMRPR